MVLEDLEGSDANSIKKSRELDEGKFYRGGEFKECPKLLVEFEQEYTFDESDVFERGILNYCRKIGLKIEDFEDTSGKNFKVVRLPLTNEADLSMKKTPVDLDALINLPYVGENLKIFEKAGFSKYSNGVGFLHLTLKDKEPHLWIDDTDPDPKKNYNLKVNFEDKMKLFKDKHSGFERTVFNETLEELVELDNSTMINLEDYEQSMEFLARFTHKIMRYLSVQDYRAITKELNVRCFIDPFANTQARWDGREWKRIGNFYVLKMPESAPEKGVCLMYTMLGTNGGYVLKPKNETTLEKEIKSAEYHVNIDNSDQTMVVFSDGKGQIKNKGNVAAVKDFIKEIESENCIAIQMTRSPRRGISPIYNVCLFELDGKKHSAEIRIGPYNAKGLPRDIIRVYTP